MTNPRGWSVITQAEVRRERWPGGNGKVVPLVQPGQEVLPDQPVLRIERNETTGETIPSGLYGKVVDITSRGGVVIECRASLVQGTIGAGGQVAGVLTIWQASGNGPGRPAIPPGAILVIPGPLNFAMLSQIVSSGVTGVIASSMPASDLEGFLRTDLIQLLEREHVEGALPYQPPLTLLLTEGLGSMAMPTRILNLLSQYQGSVVLLSGTTSTRLRLVPELIISLPRKETQQNWKPVERADPAPVLGALVRVCGGEHEGAIGVIDYLFTYEQTFSSGVRARAVRLRLDDGSSLIVPMTLVERIG